MQDLFLPLYHYTLYSFSIREVSAPLEDVLTNIFSFQDTQAARCVGKKSTEAWTKRSSKKNGTK